MVGEGLYVPSIKSGMCLVDEVEIADCVIASIMLCSFYLDLLVSWVEAHQIIFGKANNILEYILKVK